MTTYIPFLKAKTGELTAMSELSPEVKQAICPLFDFPRNNENYSEENYEKKTRKIARSLAKHWGAGVEFYFDDFDISQRIQIEGEHQYSFVLRTLSELEVIPVVGFDRTTHNSSVTGLKREGIITSNVVAFRIEREDFEDYRSKEEDIEYDLADVFNEFEEVDLLFDCRLCTNMDAVVTAQQIATFARLFSQAYPMVRRIIVTGSSIPASLRDAVNTDETATLPRLELEIIAQVRNLTGLDIITGDYATVSPMYSDMNISPQLFQKITAPKLIYSFDTFHYISRGTSLESGGQDQYVGLTNTLCNKRFFRGPGYSSGERYFDEKRRRIGNGATNGTVVKPSVVAHITYMVLSANV